MTERREGGFDRKFYELAAMLQECLARLRRTLDDTARFAAAGKLPDVELNDKGLRAGEDDRRMSWHEYRQALMAGRLVHPQRNQKGLAELGQLTASSAFSRDGKEGLERCLLLL